MASGTNPLKDPTKLWEMGLEPRMSIQNSAKAECYLNETVMDPDLIRVRQLIKDRIDLLYRKIRSKEHSATLRSSFTNADQDVRVLEAPKRVNPDHVLPSTVVKWNTLPNDEQTRDQLLTLVSERLRLNRSLRSAGQQDANLVSPSIVTDVTPVKTSARTPRQSITVRHYVHQDNDTEFEKLIIPKRNTSHLTVQRLPSIDVLQEKSAGRSSSPSRKLVNHALVQADLPRSFRITQPDDVVEVMAEVLQEEMRKVLRCTPSLGEPDDGVILSLREQNTKESDNKANAETEDTVTGDEAGEEEEEAGIDFLSLMRRLQTGASTQTELTVQQDHGTSPIGLQVENRHSQTQFKLENRSCQYSPVETSNLNEVVRSPTAHVLNNDREDGFSPPRQAFPTPSPLPSLPSSGFHDLPSPLSESPPAFPSFAERSVQVDNELLNETVIVEEATVASSVSAHDASIIEQNTTYTLSEGEVKRTLSLGEYSENRPYVLSEGELFLPARFVASAHYSTISEGEVSDGLADIPNLPQD